MRRFNSSRNSDAATRRRRRVSLTTNAVLVFACALPPSAGHAALAPGRTVRVDALVSAIAPLGVLPRALAGAPASPRFSAPAIADAGKWPGEMVAADFNGDGNADLATADSGRSISVILGKGDGSFRSRVAVAIPHGSRWQRDIATADLTGDGRPDLITTGEQGGEVSVLVNDGAGHFHIDRSYRVRASEVQTGDVNADGLVDVLVTRRASSDDLAVLLGTGGGRLAPPPLVRRPPRGRGPRGRRSQPRRSPRRRAGRR